MLNWTTKIIGGGLFFVAALAISLNGISNLLTTSKPELAQQFNPINTEARLNAVSQRLGTAKIPDTELIEMARQAEKLVYLSPHDGRGYSLLGEIRLRQNKPHEADLLFVKTLKKAPTEINALLHRINTTLQNGQFKLTMQYFDLLLRRWPKSVEKVVAVAKRMASDKSGFKILSNTLMQDPPWKRPMVTYLSKSSTGASFLQKFILREKAAGKEIDHRTIALLGNRMIAAKNYLNAYRTFVFTLTDTERKALGYVFNSDFSLPAGPRAFNWRVTETGEADIVFRLTRGSNSPGGMAVNFREVPAKLGNIYQYLMIPPGTYQLRTEATSRQLIVPKKLFWQLYCYDGGRELGRLDIPEGTYSNQSISTKFVVPGKKCSMQILRLKTDLRTTSWRARYHGSVVFQSIIVTKSHNQKQSGLVAQ